MLHFECDYACGAADKVLRALCETNGEQTSGYGEDPHCQRARALIRDKCRCPQAAVHFVPGGTQANLLVIAAALRPFEGVLCADTGHINVHETGAIEATGHKVLPLPGKDGKISAAQVREAVEAHRADGTHEHMVCPGMVYISHPTELGALYTRGELAALADTCRALGISLYLDGARLGYGLAAQPDVDLPFLAQTCDAFTIGGTKVGMLFGEAIVLCAPALQTCFRYHIKQRGAMLAKGRLLGVQFEAMLEDGSYVALSKTANGMAQELKRAFVSHGCPLLCDTQANQIFPILPDAIAGQLAEKYAFSFWQRVDEAHSAVRFCTSAVTSRADVDALLADIERIFRP
ncbi:MAG: beta-eliminating lyase-related protein [Clostridiales bacterium]|nr:beta-eliminating lyase-related protein [Clostridiales bacterium]MDO4349460.1 beta-eliminating lyase-related protein [Eubacteriales bacterium]MDY4008484.1 beta-eliminating lyase-related protein [Candidatus Limiplasma sp.]